MNDLFSWWDALKLLVGAILAIGGGFVGDWLRSWRSNVRELKAIKISLGDELGEIETTTRNMHEVWVKSKLLHPSYITDILSNTTTFDSLRQRLFLIKDQKLRKRIVKFYKELKDTAKKSEGKLGSLAETADASAEQSGFETSFQAIGKEAGDIQKELEK